MGRINEYQRKQLASRAVGTAPAARGGEIVGGSISKLGASVAKREAEVNEVYASTQANYGVIQVGLSFQKVATQLQRELAGNPDAYPDRLLKDGGQLISEYADSIADENVRGKFLGAANTILRAGVFQASGWVQTQKKKNATVAATQALRLGAVQTGQTLTKEAYLQNVATIEEMAARDIPEDVMSPQKKRAFFTENSPKMLESHFANRVDKDPKQLINELDAGAYDDVPYYTAAMKTKYLNLAKTKIRQEEKYIRDARTDNYQELVGEFTRDTLGFDMISAAETAENEVDGLEDKHINQLREGLIRRVATDAKQIEKSEPAARRYIQLTYDVFNDRVERSEVLKQIVDMFRDGEIDRDEAAQWMETKANLRELKTNRRADGWSKAAKTITDKAERFYEGTESKIQEAINLRNLSAQISLGIGPAAAAQMVLKAMDITKVIGDNPSLATFENPVEEAYRVRAIEVLKANSYSLEKANVEALIAQLREADNRPETEK